MATPVGRSVTALVAGVAITAGMIGLSALILYLFKVGGNNVPWSKTLDFVANKPGAMCGVALASTVTIGLGILLGMYMRNHILQEYEEALLPEVVLQQKAEERSEPRMLSKEEAVQVLRERPWEDLMPEDSKTGRDRLVERYLQECYESQKYYENEIHFVGKMSTTVMKKCEELLSKQKALGKKLQEEIEKYKPAVDEEIKKYRHLTAQKEVAFERLRQEVCEAQRELQRLCTEKGVPEPESFKALREAQISHDGERRWSSYGPRLCMAKGAGVLSEENVEFVVEPFECTLPEIADCTETEEFSFFVTFEGEIITTEELFHYFNAHTRSLYGGLWAEQSAAVYASINSVFSWSGAFEGTEYVRIRADYQMNIVQGKKRVEDAYGNYYEVAKYEARAHCRLAAVQQEIARVRDLPPAGQDFEDGEDDGVLEILRV